MRCRICIFTYFTDFFRLTFALWSAHAFKLQLLFGLSFFFWAIDCKCCPPLCFSCCSSTPLTRIYARTVFQLLLLLPAAVVMLSYSVLTFALPHCRFTTTLSPKLPAPPPAPPRHRPRRRRRCRCCCCCCCWCLLLVFIKTSRRLSVVLVVVIAHLGEPLCSPARWLLLVVLLPGRTSLLDHRRHRPRRCCRCCCFCLLLLMLSRSPARVPRVLLCSLLSSMMPCVIFLHKISCFPYCILPGVC